MEAVEHICPTAMIAIVAQRVQRRRVRVDDRVDSVSMLASVGHLAI